MHTPIDLPSIYSQDGSFTAEYESEHHALFFDSRMVENVALHCLSIESKGSKAHLLPDDWANILEAHVEQADLVLPEYFQPELERTIYHHKLLGGLAVGYSNANLHVYDTLEEQAAKHDKQVAAIDIAHTPAYAYYESTPPFSIHYLRTNNRGNGVASRTPNTTERWAPTPTDARRLLAARAIQQEAARWEDGGDFLYIAAPAHTARVLQYLNDDPNDPLNNARLQTYKYAMPGIKKETRSYQYDDESQRWYLYGRDKID